MLRMSRWLIPIVLVAICFAEDRNWEEANQLLVKASEAETFKPEQPKFHLTVNSHEQLCTQYLFRTDEMEYHIRPLDTKHAALLPVGREGEFKIKKDRMYLKAVDGEKKERPYQVVSMQPLNSESKAESTTSRSEKPEESRSANREGDRARGDSREGDKTEGDKARGDSREGDMARDNNRAGDKTTDRHPSIEGLL